MSAGLPASPKTVPGAITLNVNEENYDGTAGNPTGHIRNASYPANSSYRYIVAL
jgi:hypothetical protein